MCLSHLSCLPVLISLASLENASKCCEVLTEVINTMLMKVTNTFRVHEEGAHVEERDSTSDLLKGSLFSQSL